MSIFSKFFRKRKSLDKGNDDRIIKRAVEVLSIKDEKGDINFQYSFEFDYIKENGKKKAILSINDEKVVLYDGQSYIFTLKSGDFSFRLKAIPDFKSEGCHTITCMDPDIKDEDI